MPRTNPDGSRDYSYDKKYEARPEQKKRRASRGRARNALKRAGKILSGSKDVHHKDGNPDNNSPSNLTVITVRKNRGLKDKDMSKKNKSKYKKERG